jgi:hypothetical protein
LLFLLCSHQHRCGSKYWTLSWFLNKSYQPQTERIRPMFQLELNILGRSLPLLQSSDLCEPFDHGCVRECVTRVLARRHLRFSTVESNRNLHIGLP